MKNQLKVLEKEFDNSKIRTVWDKEQQKYFISITDIVRVLTESDNPRKYWSVLKTRLKKEGSELATTCSQLKLQAADGKYYNTDVIDIEGMFRLIESIPSKKAEPIKLWLARLGKERIDEEYDNVNETMYFDNLKDVRNYADEIICFYSKNDPYVKYEAEKEFADTIATKQIVIDDGGHLNSESGYTEFTELLKYI